MPIDIKPGDLLIVDGVAMPVAAVPTYSMLRMSYRSFLRMAPLEVSTKRAENSGGKITPASDSDVYLSGLRAMPLDPLNGEAAAGAEKTLGIEKPSKMMQTFISDGESFVHVFVEKRL